MNFGRSRVIGEDCSNRKWESKTLSRLLSVLRSKSERIQVAGGGSALRADSIDGMAVAVLQSGQEWGRVANV